MAQMAARRKLVVFDVEGVLLPKNRYLVFEVGRNLSFLQFIRLLFIGLLYEVGMLSLESALKKMFRLFRGFRLKKMSSVFMNLPLLPHTETVFRKLREKGVKTALVSSGLPQVVVEILASRLKADYAFGLELETNNGVLTGDIRGDIIQKNGKAFVMKDILDRENLERQDCAVVADDRNNASIFYPETLKIGYNPDFLITLKSDYVIRRSLLEIVPILEGTQRRRRSSLSYNEVIRETIHASGFFVALAAIHFGIYLIAFLLFVTTTIYTASELARIERKKVPLISSITLNAVAPSEFYEFALAPIFLALGITFSLLLFPTPINYASIAIVSFGDSAASIFGKMFGKTPVFFNKGKNLEGSVAGFAFGFFGAAFFLQPLQAFIGAIVGTFVEALPLPINDNLSTPLVAGATLSLLSILL